MGAEGPALGPALPLREPLGRPLLPRAPVPRLTALVALALAAACAGTPPPPAPEKDDLRQFPEVICQPCGQMQPRGFVCSGPVMIREDVPRKRVPLLKRYCAEKRKRTG